MDTETRECVLDWRNKVFNEALQWHHTPFHHKARIKGVGCDCGGFIYEVFKITLGIPHEPFPKNYAEDWSMHKDDNEIFLDFMKPYVIPTDRLALSDLVVYKFGRAFSHATLYIGNNEVIHSFGRSGSGSVMKTNLNNFNLGTHGRARAFHAFTLDEKWLV